MDPGSSIDAEGSGVDLFDAHLQLLVLGPSGRDRAVLPGMVAGARHTQHAGEPGNGMMCLLFSDQGVLHFG